MPPLERKFCFASLNKRESEAEEAARPKNETHAADSAEVIRRFSAHRSPSAHPPDQVNILLGGFWKPQQTPIDSRVFPAPDETAFLN